MENKQQLVSFYVRVSTKDKGQELEQQITELNREVAIWNARGENWKVYKIYSDKVSASKLGEYEKRIGLKEMFEDARKHEFDCLLIWSQDRFSRLDILQAYRDLIRLVLDYKIRYRTVVGHLDSTGDPTTFNIMLAIKQEEAKEYSKNLSRNVTRGINSGYKDDAGNWVKPWGNAILSERLISSGIIQQILTLQKNGKSYSEIKQEVYYYTKKGNKRFVSKGFISKVIAISKNSLTVHETPSELLEQNIPKNELFIKEVFGEQVNNNKSD